MVAYEDLVVALTNWRINQGLPTGDNAFAAFETGSVDLALPVADPVELRTGEVLSIDDDAGIEEIADADQDVSHSDAESYGAYDDVAASDRVDDAGLDYEAAPHEEALDYAEETAYGDMPQMDDMESEPEPLRESMSADDVGEGSYVPDPLVDPRTEEVDVLAAEDEIDHAMDALAEVSSSEEISADEMAIEDEIEADGMEAIADDFDPDEMPTRFGDDDDNPESTVMGIGIDELRPADES